jgi:hypothetical protein
VATPPNVARAYLEANFAHDWQTTWELQCESARSQIGDYPAYLRGQALLEKYEPPMDVDVSVTDVHEAAESPQPAVAVEFTVSRHGGDPEYWKTDGGLLVVKEDGAARVCGLIIRWE